MVTFQFHAGGYAVLIGGQKLGHIIKGIGFFIGPVDIRTSVIITSEALRQIALKVEEFR